MSYRNSEGYYDPTAGAALAQVRREERRKAYKPLVYICSRYAGNIENNISAARDYCRYAVGKGYIPVASHLLYPQFMDDADPEQRKLGLFFGNVLMDRCDEVWIFGKELSSGIQAQEGRYVPVEEVHHIVPLSRGGTNDESNLMSLCRSCHEKIHHEMGDR